MTRQGRSMTSRNQRQGRASDYGHDQVTMGWARMTNRKRGG